jgi:hypothetical protein
VRHAFRRSVTPLVFYYAVTLALPLANGAGGSAFLDHALVVAAVPPVLIVLFCLARATVVLPFRGPESRPSTFVHPPKIRPTDRKWEARHSSANFG